MKIIKTDIHELEKNKVMVYKMTKAPSLSVQKMTDEQLAAVYPVTAYLLYEDVNSRGETIEVLSILSGSDVISTVSATLKKSFFEIVEIMGDDEFSIRFRSGESKNKRRFFDCVLDC